ARSNQNRESRVCVLPKREEILIRLARCRTAPPPPTPPPAAPIGERIQRRNRIPATMIENGLEFIDCQRWIINLQIGLPAQVLRPEVTEDFIFTRSLEDLDCLRAVATVELALRPNNRH